MDNKDQAKGKLKQAVGDLTDNKHLKDKGKADEKAGDAKELVGKLGDKAGELIDAAKKALTKD
ncbi:MAG: CsbD family protein [Ilumatobacteraceae bacterium]